MNEPKRINQADIPIVLKPGLEYYRADDPAIVSALRCKAAMERVKSILKTRCLSIWENDSGECFIDTDNQEHYQANDLLTAIESIDEEKAH